MRTLEFCSHNYHNTRRCSRLRIAGKVQNYWSRRHITYSRQWPFWAAQLQAFRKGTWLGEAVLLGGNDGAHTPCSLVAQRVLWLPNHCHFLKQFLCSPIPYIRILLQTGTQLTKDRSILWEMTWALSKSQAGLLRNFRSHFLLSWNSF